MIVQCSGSQICHNTKCKHYRPHKLAEDCEISDVDPTCAEHTCHEVVISGAPVSEERLNLLRDLKPIAKKLKKLAPMVDLLVEWLDEWFE